MNIITIVLDFFYEMFYGWNSVHLIITAVLLALFYNWAFNRGYDARELDEEEEKNKPSALAGGADSSKRWRFREGELIAPPSR